MLSKTPKAINVDNHATNEEENRLDEEELQETAKNKTNDVEKNPSVEQAQVWKRLNKNPFKLKCKTNV